MRNSWKWVLGTTAAVLTAAIGAGYYFLVYDINWAKGAASRYASDQSGRKASIEGNLRVEWSRKPRFILEDFHFGNAEWSKEKDMASAERIEVVIDALELLRGRMVLPEILLVGPTLALERQANGDSNWTFGAEVAKDVAKPEDRTEFPLIGTLSIERGKLIYRDLKTGIDLAGDITSVTGTGGQGRQDVTLNGQGRLQGEPFRLRLTGGSLVQLREAEEPYPLRVELDATSTVVRIAGTLDAPIKFEGLKLEIALKGDNLGRLSKMTGVPVPDTPPYDLKGNLVRDGAIWAIENLNGRVGHSDLGGKLRFDTSKPRLFIEGDLVSRNLDYRDVGPLIGIPAPTDGENAAPVPAEVKAIQPAGKPLAKAAKAQPAPQAKKSVNADGESFQRVLPDVPLNIDAVREVDARIKYRSAKVFAPGAPLEKVELDLELKDGLLQFKPLKLSIAQGDVIAAIDIDARQEVVQTRYDLRLRRFLLERFLDEAGLKDRGQGRIDGRIRLHGSGDTVARSLGRADGDIRLVMSSGQLSTLGIELAGLDLAEALGFAVSGDKKADIRCAVVDLAVEQGIITPRVFVIDTTDSTLTADGVIGLAQEQLDFSLLAHPKDPSPFSIRSPITVRGHFASPSLGVKAGPLAARAGAAIALGVLLTPLAAILAFIEPGLEGDSDCAQLLAEHRAKK